MTSRDLAERHLNTWQESGQEFTITHGNYVVVLKNAPHIDDTDCLVVNVASATCQGRELPIDEDEEYRYLNMPEGDNYVFFKENLIHSVLSAHKE